MKKVIIFIILLLVFTGCNNKSVLVDNSIENSDTGVSIFDDQNITNVIIANMNVAFYDNISHIAFIIKNENNNDVTYDNLKISYYAENDVLVYEIEAADIGTISSNSAKNIYLETDVNLSSTINVKYELS